MGASSAQTVEKCAPVTPGSDKFAFDISLPTPDEVKSIDLTADGKPLNDAAKLDMHAIKDGSGDYVCDVVLLVDKAAGGDDAGAAVETKAVQSFLKRVVSKALATDRNRQLTRDQMARQGGSSAPAKAAPLYQLEVATIDGSEAQTLVPFGSDEPKLDEAIKETKLAPAAPKIAHGLQSVLSDLQASTADRKFIVLVSTGHFSDADTSFDDAIRMAKDAKIKICTVGFNDGQEDNGLTQLATLAEETKGFPLATDKVNSDDEFPLAEERIDDLLAYMVAGAQGTFELNGLTGPVTVGFQIKTGFDKTYSAEEKVNVAAAGAAPATNSTQHPASPTVSSTKPKAFSAADWVSKNPGLAIAAGVVVLVLLLLLVMRGKRAAAVPEAVVELPEENDAIVTKGISQDEPTGHILPVEEQPVLAWLSNGDTRYPLGKRSVGIGRRSDNEIVLEDDSVSQYHAEIIYRDDNFYVLDRGSSNKVLIDGKPVHKVPLNDGDVLELGDLRLRFELNPNWEIK